MDLTFSDYLNHENVNGFDSQVVTKLLTIHQMRND
jgi:hypothetical protein